MEKLDTAHMYDRMTDFKYIYEAYRHTARGKRKKTEVIRYDNNLYMRLFKLKLQLEKGEYAISGYHRFMIHDPKDREIQALSFDDRVFQQLLADRVLRPYFEPRLIYDNAACRVGKGTHFAMNRFCGFLREHYKQHDTKGYILRFDIRKYFDSIDHEVLKKKLARIPDERIRTLLYQIIDTYEKTPGRGLPMGNQSSQWFALYYLDRLDRFIKEKLRIKHYVRYMDDGVIIHPDKSFLKDALRQMRELIGEDRLEFNQKTQIFPISQGTDFLGFRFYLTDTGKVIKRVRTSAKKRFKRNMKNYVKLYRKGEIKIADIQESVRSMQAHLRYGHTRRLIDSVMWSTVFSPGTKREVKEQRAALEAWAQEERARQEALEEQLIREMSAEWRLEEGARLEALEALSEQQERLMWELMAQAEQRGQAIQQDRCSKQEAWDDTGESEGVWVQMRLEL